MKIIRNTRIVPIYRTVENEHGEFLEITKTGEAVTHTVDILADKGKLLMQKDTRIVVGTSLTLGGDEKPEDYTEIDADNEVVKDEV